MSLNTPANPIIYEQGLRIAVQGCGHGALNSIYSSIRIAEKRHNFKVDILIICGDFQAVRNAQDLNCMSVPRKYRRLGDFHLYYSGKIKAPILTLFVGGNHEAANHSWELFYGGWVCPNIYYLGAANVVRIGGLRIAGMSGIYNKFDYNNPHYERLPYGGKDVKTIYHVRQYETYKLFQLRESVDIGLSHDWPLGIEHHGDINWLLRTKPWFKKDIDTNSLGSPPARSLLYKWRPRYWFSGHMHVKFPAMVVHNASQQGSIGGLEGNVQEILSNKDEINLDSDLLEEAQEHREEIDIDMEIDEPVNKIPNPVPSQDNITKFLALDKCLPGRDFLQILEIPARISDRFKPDDPKRLTLQYDIEWLAITRVLNPFLATSQGEVKQVEKDEAKLQQMIDEERKWVEENIVKRGKLDIPYNWEKTAPAENEEDLNPHKQPPEYNNPQTGTFCEILGIDNKIWSTDEQKKEYIARWKNLQSQGDASYAGKTDYKGGWKGGGNKQNKRNS